MQQFSRLTPDEKELFEIVKRSTPKSPEKPPRDNPKSSVHSEKSKVSTNKGRNKSIPKSPKSSVNKGSTKKVIKKVPIEEKENEDDDVIEVPRERKAQDLMIPDPISGFFRDAHGRLTPKSDPLENELTKRTKSTSENMNPNSSKHSSVNKNSERSRRISSNASPISRGKEKRTPVEELSSRLDVIFEDSQYDIQIEVQRVGESHPQFVTSFSQEITEMEIMNRNNENKNSDVMEIKEKPVIVVPKIEIMPPRRTALKSVRRIESLTEPPRRRLLTRNSEIIDHEPEVINIEENQNHKEVIEVIEEEPQQNLDDSTIRVTIKDGVNHEEEEGDDVMEIIETSSKPKSESIKSEEDRMSENFEKQRNKLQKWREQHENLMYNIEKNTNQVPVTENPESVEIVEIVDETDRMEIEENKQPQQNEEAPEVNEQEDQIQITKAGDIYSGGDLNNLMEIIEESPSAEEGTQGQKLQDSDSQKDSENKEQTAEDTTNETYVDQSNQTQGKEQSSETIVENVDVYITEVVTATQYIESQELTGLTIARRFIPRVPLMEDDKPVETQEEREELATDMVNTDNNGAEAQDENLEEKEIEKEQEGVIGVSEEAVRVDDLINEENPNEKVIVTEEIYQTNLDEIQEEVIPERENNDIQAEHDQLHEQVQEETTPEIKDQDPQVNAASVPVEIQEEMAIEVKSQGQEENNSRQDLVEISEQMIIPEEKENIQAQIEEIQEEMIPNIKENTQGNDQEAIAPEVSENIQTQAQEEKIDQSAPVENQEEMVPEIKESQGQYEENNKENLVELSEHVIISEEQDNTQAQYHQANIQEEEIALEVKSNPQTHEDQVDQFARVEIQEEMVIETKESQRQEEEDNRHHLIEMPEQMIVPEENDKTQAQFEKIQEEMIPEIKENAQGSGQEAIAPEVSYNMQAQEGHTDQLAPAENQGEMIPEIKESQGQIEDSNQQYLVEAPEQMIPEEKENTQVQDEQVSFSNLVQVQEEIIPEETSDNQIDKSSPIKESQVPEIQSHFEPQDDQIGQSAPMEIQEEMIIETKESQGHEEENNRQDLVEMPEQMIVPEENDKTQAQTEEIQEEIIPEIKESQGQIEDSSQQNLVEAPEQKENAQENYQDQEETVPEIRENIQAQGDENNQLDADKMQEELIHEVESTSQTQMEITDAPRDENQEKEQEQEILVQQENYGNVEESVPNKEDSDENEEIIEEMVKPGTPKQSQPTIIIGETQIAADTVKNSQPTFIIAETQELEVNNHPGAMVNILETVYETEKELEVAESPKKPASAENNERMEILDLPQEQVVETEHKEVSQEPIHEDAGQMEILESPKEAEVRDQETDQPAIREIVEALESPKGAMETQIQEPIYEVEQREEVVELPKEADTSSVEEIHPLDQEPGTDSNNDEEVRIFKISRMANIEVMSDQNQQEVMEILDSPKEQVVIEVEHKETDQEIEVLESPKEAVIEVHDQENEGVMEIVDSPEREVMEIVESPKVQPENHDLIILGSEVKDQVEVVSVGSHKTREEIQIDSSKKDERESQHEEYDDGLEEVVEEEIEILESEEEEKQEKPQQTKKNLIEQIYQEFAQEDIIDLDQQEESQGERVYEEVRGESPIQETSTEVKEGYNVTEEEILQNYIKPRVQPKIQEDDDEEEDISQYKEEEEEPPEDEDVYQGDEDTSVKKEEEGIYNEYPSASTKKAGSARREYTVYEDWRILESLAAYERQHGPSGSKSIKTWETLKDPLTKRKLLEDERTAESLKNRMHKTLCLLPEEDKKQIADYIKRHSQEEAMSAFCRFENSRSTEKKKFKGILTELHHSDRKTPSSQSQKSASKKKDKPKSYGLVQKAFEDNENDEVEDIIIPIDDPSLPREDMFYPSMGQHHFRDYSKSDASAEVFMTEPNSLNYEVSFNQPFAFINNSRSNSNKKIVRTNNNNYNNNNDVQSTPAPKSQPKSNHLFHIYKEEIPVTQEEVVLISRAEAMQQQQQNQGSGGRSERQKESKKRKDYRMPNAQADPEEFTNCLKKVKTTKYFEERSLLISDEFKYKFSAEKEKFKPPSKDINVFVDSDHNFRQFVVESSQQTEENSSQNAIIERLVQIAAKYHMHQEDVLHIFHAVSNDFDDLLLYLKTKNEFIPWEPSEDQDLLENDPTAIRYLRQLKGEERMNRRREYLMGE